MRHWGGGNVSLKTRHFPRPNVSSAYTLPMKKWIPLIISAVAVVAMCAFVFSMSAMPADDSNALSTGVIWHIVGFIVPGYDQLPAADQLHWQEALQRPVRKTAHFLEYATLGALMLNLVAQIERTRRLRRSEGAGGGARPKPPTLPRLAFAAWVLTTLYATTDEIHQLLVPGRTGQATDVILDSFGSLTGIALALLALRAIRRRRVRR